jgi:DMSO/TMAO reductase YedYZ heme-binding membrane subunit
MSIAATIGPSAEWYLTRGSGVVALLLLTASVALGVLGSVGVTGGRRWPRFAIDSLHRDVSLLVIVVLVIHIVTTVLDGYAPITLLDAVVPFASAYRPLWLGLGAVAFDLLIALTVTSVLRRRLGYRTWRAVHWLAYASWPVAVLHGLGTGSDSRQAWALALTFACVAVVAVAVVWRVLGDRTVSAAGRRLAVAAAVAAPLAIAAFAVLGPLRDGWARRAGTPPRLLASAIVPGRVLVDQRPAHTVLKLPLSARLAGTVRRHEAAGGALLDLVLRVTGGASGELRVRLAGAEDGSGGLVLTGSQVDLLAAGLPSVMQGQIVRLAGETFTARVHGASGARLDLRVALAIDNRTGQVSGTLAARSAGRAGRRTAG